MSHSTDCQFFRCRISSLVRLLRGFPKTIISDKNERCSVSFSSSDVTMGKEDERRLTQHISIVVSNDEGSDSIKGFPAKYNQLTYTEHLTLLPGLIARDHNATSNSVR